MPTHKRLGREPDKRHTIDMHPPTRPLNRKELGERVAQLISNERRSTHGDPSTQFTCAQEIKDTLERYTDYEHCNIDSKGLEALDMICTKISRLLNGKNLQDHWLDIAGYALIAAEGAEQPLMKETE